MTQELQKLPKVVLGVLPGSILALPSAASAVTFNEAIHGREALVFTSSITLFTLALFVVYLALALRQKRS